MKAVVLVHNRPFDLGALGEAFRPYGEFHRTDPFWKNRIVVVLDGGWFDVDCAESLRNQFDDEELAYLRSQLTGDLFFAGLSYSDDRIVDMAINHLPLAPDVLVDNDYGLVLPVSEVRRRIQAGDKWYTAKT